MGMVQINQNGDVRQREGGNGRISTILKAIGGTLGVVTVATAITSFSDYQNDHRYFVNGDGGFSLLKGDAETVVEDANVLMGKQGSSVYIFQSASMAWGMVPRVGIAAEPTDVAVARGNVGLPLSYQYFCAVEKGDNEGTVVPFNAEEPIPQTLIATYSSKMAEGFENASGSCPNAEFIPSGSVDSVRATLPVFKGAVPRI